MTTLSQRLAVTSALIAVLVAQGCGEECTDASSEEANTCVTPPDEQQNPPSQTPPTISANCEGGYPADLIVRSLDEPELKRFEAHRCTEIRGRLDMDRYADTTWPSWFKRLRVVDNGIQITHTQLQEIDLEQLERVDNIPAASAIDGDDGGAKVLNGNLDITENDHLERIASFSRLTRISGSFWVRGNKALHTIEWLPILTDIGHDLWIRNNDALVTVEDFSMLRRVRDIKIGFNPQLTTMPDFTDVREAADVEIVGNDVLPRAPGLTSVSQLHNLRITDNAALTDIDTYTSLQYICHEVRIANNASLTYVSALQNLLVVGHCEDEPNASQPSTTANQGAPILPTLGLFILDNARLTSLNFYRLENVRGDLELRGNAELEAFGSFYGLQHIDGQFIVADNAALHILDDLSALKDVGSVSITNNPALSQCYLDTFFDAITIDSSSQSDMSGNDDAATCD